MSSISLDILLLHTNTSHSLTIYMLEGTTTISYTSHNYFINLTKITFTTYSHTSTLDPSNATILGTDDHMLPLRLIKPTIFNILSTTAADVDVVEVVGSEIGLFLIELDDVFVGYDCGMQFDNLYMTSQHVDEGKNVVFIELFGLMGKSFEVTNSYFDPSGTVLMARDPLNLYLENVTVDGYRYSSGMLFYDD